MCANVQESFDWMFLEVDDLQQLAPRLQTIRLEHARIAPIISLGVQKSSSIAQLLFFFDNQTRRKKKEGFVYLFFCAEQQQKKKNKMKALWILYIVYIIIGVALLILFVLFFRPQKTTTLVNANTLQSAYNNGNGNLDVEFTTKPFAVRMTQQGVHYNAATFSNSGAVIDSFLTRVVGNSFSSTQPITITSLQVVYDYMSADVSLAPRQIAIYDLETRQQVVSGTVSLTDPVVDGFFTHAIPNDQQPTLILDRHYAIVALIATNDFYARGRSVVQSSNVVVLRERTDVTSDTLFLPNADQFGNENAGNLQFASFQYVKEVVNQLAFQVDVRSQNASFPKNYVYNLNVQVNANTVALEPGICMSDAENNNMLNNTIGNLILSPEVVGVANGLDIGTLEASQWYAVFLITSTVQGMPPAGLLSKNRQMPSVLPTGYESSKRVGWARTDDTLAFLPMMQQGNGTRRQTFYVEPLPILGIRSFTPVQIDEEQYFQLSLPLVSPTCSSVVLNLQVENYRNSQPVTVRIREPNAQFDVVKVIANLFTVTMLTVEVPITDFNAPHKLEMALSMLNTAINPVEVTVQVQSFFDDL